MNNVIPLQNSPERVSLLPIAPRGDILRFRSHHTPSVTAISCTCSITASLGKSSRHWLVTGIGGGHYRWPGWLDRINTSGLKRSMSRKGCSSDNAACEGFFGRVKNEMFYGRNWAGITLEKFICLLDRYIRWYNERRIKLSLGAMSPVKYRQHLGITT